MNFRTVSDLNALISNNLTRIPQDVDLVIGVPRSGMLVATLVCLYTNLPLVDIDAFVRGELYQCGATKRRSDWVIDASDVKRALVVEDSSSSGNSIGEARCKLMDARPDVECIFLAAYVTREARQWVDVWLEVCPQPRMFEWNFLHHGGLANACFDIDGVLCDDPTEEQNDDGPRYRAFLANAPKRVSPTFEIGYLVTSRLEKYRSETVGWLNANEIHFRELRMMQYATKEERLQRGNHGRFKAEHYKSLHDSSLFVESDPAQAAEIATLSGKTVFCTGNQQVYSATTAVQLRESVALSAKGAIRRYIPKPIKRMVKSLVGGGVARSLAADRGCWFAPYAYSTSSTSLPYGNAHGNPRGRVRRVRVKRGNATIRSLGSSR